MLVEVCRLKEREEGDKRRSSRRIIVSWILGLKLIVLDSLPRERGGMGNYIMQVGRQVMLLVLVHNPEIVVLFYFIFISYFGRWM